MFDEVSMVDASACVTVDDAAAATDDIVDTAWRWKERNRGTV